MTSRNTFYHALLFAHTGLLLVVALLLWWGNRRATLSSRRQLDDLRKRVESLASQVDTSLSAAPRVGDFSPSRSSNSQVDTSLSAAPRVGSSSLVRVPPRVLGSGRSGSWVYVDVCYGDGTVCRHYCRRSSTPSERSSFVRQLAEQSARHSWVSSDGFDL